MPLPSRRRYAIDDVLASIGTTTASSSVAAPPVVDRSAHRRLEEAVGTLAFVLGAIECGVGMGEQRMWYP